MKTVRIYSIWSKRKASDPAPTYSVEVCPVNYIDALEAAFAMTNADNRPLSNRFCSTSTGDVMVVDGRTFLVEGVGFNEITDAEFDKISKLSSRDTSMGYAWLKQNNLI